MLGKVVWRLLVLLLLVRDTPSALIFFFFRPFYLLSPTFNINIQSSFCINPYPTHPCPQTTRLLARTPRLGIPRRLRYNPTIPRLSSLNCLSYHSRPRDMSAAQQVLALPEVLSLILEYLEFERAALYSAHLVNTTWARYTQGILWRNAPLSSLVAIEPARQQQYANMIRVSFSWTPSYPAELDRLSFPLLERCLF